MIGKIINASYLYRISYREHPFLFPWSWQLHLHQSLKNSKAFGKDIMGDSIYTLEVRSTISRQQEDGLKPPLDLSHHFSRVTRARKESSVKEFYKYFAVPGIGNLAGGKYEN